MGKGLTISLGINPWPTFDFNVISGWIQSSYNPLVVPGFTTFNLWVGMVIGLFFSAAFYWTNTCEYCLESCCGRLADFDREHWIPPDQRQPHL